MALISPYAFITDGLTPKTEKIIRALTKDLRLSRPLSPADEILVNELGRMLDLMAEADRRRADAEPGGEWNALVALRERLAGSMRSILDKLAATRSKQAINQAKPTVAAQKVKEKADTEHWQGIL